MEFDFLPKLPKSNLDDRTFKDLVDECILRIPRYCPEWTNYNPGDPGITLIELFAWLTDQMLLRFNQIPRRQYVAFLELLGIRLHPPVPARTELTFYLTTALPTVYQIPAGTEVATLRTESEPAIVFSTDRPLTIGLPRIAHLLTAETQETTPQVLRDRLTNLWNPTPAGGWEGRQQFIFNPHPQPGNCCYLVFEPGQSLEGNVIAMTLRGEAATSTGIDPGHPPRRWEAWDGQVWQPILLQESDDGTRGFSFSDIGQVAPNQIQAAEVLLHLPQQWPVTDFATYQGRWLRCVYTAPAADQPGYSNSPQLMGVEARSVGGTVGVSQCSLIRDELLGESSGIAGQSFQLQGRPILPRVAGEHLLVTPPGGLPQIWQEVGDFAASGPLDRHYILDSLTGWVQFGPLIRESTQLKEQIYERARLQVRGEPGPLGQRDGDATQGMERQYGAVPPRGATLRMVAYRTGGGQQGNVQRGTLQVLKSAVPYVARVVNHGPAYDGADAESLEDAVIRVPRLLRTRDRAVTPEDFESLALQAGRGAVARAYCPRREAEGNSRGCVKLLIVPQTSRAGINRAEGIAPATLGLTPTLQTQVLSYLDERRLLGVQVKLQEPEYVGVSVHAEVGLNPEYNHPQAQQEILQQLRVKLYQFLNPLTGGVEGQGWPFGRAVYPSDIISLIQKTPGVRYLGVVLLFELRRQQESWVRTLAPDGVVDPGSLGLVCSWAEERWRSGHIISLLG